jgi:nitrous oxidase accessory protein
LELEIAGDENQIEGNAFLSNNRKAHDRGHNNRWDDGRKGNYWSDYLGKDANGDGIGDTPYAVVPNGSDRFPLMADPTKR